MERELTVQYAWWIISCTDKKAYPNHAVWIEEKEFSMKHMLYGFKMLLDIAQGNRDLPIMAGITEYHWGVIDAALHDLKHTGTWRYHGS